MSELVIIQMTAEQLREMMDEAVDRAVQKVLEAHSEPVLGPDDERLLGVGDICSSLGIGRSRFEHYKDELIRAGMFQLDGKGSSYKIKRKDFEKWIDTKYFSSKSRERAEGCSLGS